MAYVELHNHTEQSLLDGLPRASEAAARAVENGNPALAITDHGTCAGHIEHQRECLAAGIAPIFGIEAYFQPDRLVRPPDTKDQQARLKEMFGPEKMAIVTPEYRRLDAEVRAAKDAQGALRGGRHLILLAQGERGLRDMWAASTEASATGYYWKPRMDWALLEERGSDLIATTACLGGIISQDLLAGLRDRTALDRALADLDRLKATFPGRLYLEMQANELPEQIRLNRLLVELSAAFGLPLVAACDAHYLTPEDAPLHREWMLCQTGAGKEDYWHFSPMLPEVAVRASLGYLDPKVVDSAIRNTVEVAERCTARIDWHVPLPVFTPGGTHDDDARRLRALCDAALSAANAPRLYRDRTDYEFDVVAAKHFAGCYLIVEELVSYARSQGVLVGPGRGSAAGSLMSYQTGITSIDPIEAGLMFERFLTPGRESMPDFDLDFPTSKRPMIQDHVMARYGSDHVVRVGTVLRYQSKGILNKLSSVHARELPDDAPAHFKEMAQIIDEAEAGTAGLGLPWDEILTDPRIAAYALKYPRIFETATRLHGRVHAAGQHPAGLIISPQTPLDGQLPMRREEGGKSMLVSQWDYRAADDLGLFKLDNLTLRTLDSLQEACDLVEARTGIRQDPRAWSGQYGDPQVFEEISGGHTLGMFQLETSLCRQYCLDMKPGSLADLADLTTFVRPGPRNSGATARYLLRRAGREVVTYPHPLLEEILAPTHGVMLYQEQVMNACKALAGYDDLEADGVRKILGKKLTSKVQAAGEEFVRRCVDRGHDEEQMTALWADMAEFGKYAFNKSHGFSYGVLSYWTAWMKAHYPVEMLTGILSTLDKMDRMAEFATEARRIGISVLPPDARFSGGAFAADGMSIRYGLTAIHGVGPQAIAKITAGQPYASYDDFARRSGVNSGVLAALARAGALDALVPSRRGLVRVIESDKDGSSVRCVHKDDEAEGPGGLPCTYDWLSEPAPPPRLGVSGRQLKVIAKPPPKRCTVACRRYTPPSLPGMDGWGEYPPDALFRQDMEVYGTWMSDVPFARLEQLGAGMRERARRVALAVADSPEGSYPMTGILAEWHRATTRRGGAMWWVKLATEVSVMDLACFSPLRDSEADVPAQLRAIRPGTLVAAEVVKRSYMSNGTLRMGWRLADVWALGS
jgi:DNA polymerase III subunit alpha